MGGGAMYPATHTDRMGLAGKGRNAEDGPNQGRGDGGGAPYQGRGNGGDEGGAHQGVARGLDEDGDGGTSERSSGQW